MQLNITAMSVVPVLRVRYAMMDVVKVTSITSVADLEKQKLDEEEAQLKRELKEESNQPMTDNF